MILIVFTQSFLIINACKQKCNTCHWLLNKVRKEKWVTTKTTPNLGLFLWEHTGSNRGPSACKADALNQLSYAPLFWDGKDKGNIISPKKNLKQFTLTIE